MEPSELLLKLPTQPNWIDTQGGPWVWRRILSNETNNEPFGQKKTQRRREKDEYNQIQRGPWCLFKCAWPGTTVLLCSSHALHTFHPVMMSLCVHTICKLYFKMGWIIIAEINRCKLSIRVHHHIICAQTARTSVHNTAYLFTLLAFNTVICYSFKLTSSKMTTKRKYKYW